MQLRPHEASNPGDVRAPQDPQIGPSSPLPCAHWSLQAASEASSSLIVTEWLSGAWGQCTAELTHAHRGAQGHPSTASTEHPLNPHTLWQHPRDPLASN